MYPHVAVEIDARTGAMAVLPGPAPKENDIWRFNLCRYDYSVKLEDGVELSVCGPKMKKDIKRKKLAEIALRDMGKWLEEQNIN